MAIRSGSRWNGDYVLSDGIRKASGCCEFRGVAVNRLTALGRRDNSAITSLSCQNKAKIHAHLHLHDLIGGLETGDALCYWLTVAFLMARTSLWTPRSFCRRGAFGPSDLASLGLSWTSMNPPSPPAATAARESTGMNCGWPPETAWPFALAEGS